MHSVCHCVVYIPRQRPLLFTMLWATILGYFSKMGDSYVTVVDLSVPPPHSDQIGQCGTAKTLADTGMEP